MEEPKKAGRKKKIGPLKKPYTISLTPDEIERLEKKAEEDGSNASAFIIKKTKIA